MWSWPANAVGDYQQLEREREAEEKTIDYLEEWFRAIEEGSAAARFPSPDCRIPQDTADRLVEEIDLFFEDEVGRSHQYWASRGIDLAPEFKRLGAQQRLALAEGLKAIWSKVYASEEVENSQAA